jgi:3-dehydroquinate dehydratase-2
MAGGDARRALTSLEAAAGVALDAIPAGRGDDQAIPISLAQVEQAAAEHAVALGHTLVAFQSNHEGALIDRIEQRDYDAIVINPGALTHTSYALHDALIGAECPSVEIHISDILSREAWRRVSVIEPVVSHRIMGHGWRGYLEAIDFLHELAARTARPETPEDQP